MNLKEVNLNTNELAAVIALCGYETMAEEILNSMNLELNNSSFNRFIEQTEQSLTLKGFIDDNRDSTIIADIEKLIHILVQSKKKIRCIKRNTVLFIHSIKEEEKILIQKIEEGIHTFSIQSQDKGIQTNLVSHFELNQEFKKQESLPTLQLSEEIYNQLHLMDSELLDSMINDKTLDQPLSLFLADFKLNQQEFDNLSFIEIDYVKNYFEMKQVIFLLPSQNFVWHLDYDNIEKKEVYVVPYESKTYGIGLYEDVMQFLNENYITL